MKKFLLHPLGRSCIATFAALFFSTNVLAAGEDITDLINSLQNVANKAASSVADYIYEFNPLSPKTAATNLNATTANQSMEDYTKVLSLCHVYNALPRHNKAPSPLIPEEFRQIFGNQYKDLDTLCSSITSAAGITINKKAEPDAFKKQLAGLVTTDSESHKKTSVFSINKRVSSALINDQSFNFENLILPNLYSNTEKDNAFNFVAFAAKTYEPFPVTQATWNRALEDPVFSTSPAFIDYKMGVRSYIAAQSFAVSNLYRMISERTKQPEITKLNLKDDQDNLIESPLQYQEYLATQRVNNPKWYQTMNTASANTLSREMVSILAEIQRSLFRMEKTNERILATLSIMELISLNASVLPELKILAPTVESYGKMESITPQR